MVPFRAAVVGHPVMHSLSPAMHNAAYKYLDIDWEYEAIDLSPERATGGIKELFQNGFKGLNVTMPLKYLAWEISTAHGSAARLKTVNTLIPDEEGILHGYSTDGEGFISALKSEDADPAQKRVLVLGAGGASRAICDALVHENANVLVCARNLDQSLELVELIKTGNTDSGSSESGAIDIVDFSVRESFLDEVDIIVNTTPLGMTLEGKVDIRMPVDISKLKGKPLVVDSIYHPLETEFLKQSAELGCKTINGIGMLVGQGAISFQLMTGQKAPIEVMRNAVSLDLENG